MNTNFNEEIKRFEVGKSYRSVTGACIEIVSRTNLALEYRYMGENQKIGIYPDEYQHCEYIQTNDPKTRFFATKEVVLSSGNERVRCHTIRKKKRYTKESERI